MNKVVIFSQIENRNLFPTPNAASLGMYGQVPVDNFTGLPQVVIPLYEFRSGGITVPLALSYHAGGVKPSDHGSWVGQGWTLVAGGAITRVINDVPDEWINFVMAANDGGNPAAIDSNKNGFFYNYSLLGNSNWTSSTLSTEYSLVHPSIYSPSPSYAYQHRRDKAPDEFSFNFLGMSGSLFMDQSGNWQVKSKDGLNFAVEYVTGPYIVQDPNCTYSGSTIYNCLTKFVLTGNDGTKYFFGADTISNANATCKRYGTCSGSWVQNWGLGKKNFYSNDSTAIEFTRVGTGGGDATKGRDGGTVPMSWYLTKIKTTNGDSVTFDYSRDGYQIINNPAASYYHYTCANCNQQSGSGGSTYGADDQLTILDGVSLTSITGVNGSLKFNKSKANIRDYTLVGSIPSYTVALFCAYGWELFNGGMPTCSTGEVEAKHSTFVKLDSITLADNAKNLQTFQFKYTENTTNRLFLDSVMVKGADNSIVNVTRFGYNNKSALANIPYETVRIDHWGYYNGVNPLCSYFSSPSTCSGTFNWQNLLNPSITDYFNNRAPNADSMMLGVLTSIVYPTGGNTQFVWEPNYYSKTINQTFGSNFSISVTDQNNSIIGGGLRIKQINSTAGFNAPVLTKSYKYCRDYVHHNNFLSSGVLNGAPPSYIDTYSQTGQFSDTIWTSYNRTPMHQTNGSLITYTNVVEVNSDSSISEYIYSNHDNGYLDRTPVASKFQNYSNFNFQDYRTSSTELERGLLLQENHYNASAVLLQKKSFQYNNNANRYDGAVRRYLDVNKFSLAGDYYSPIDGFFPGGAIYQGADLYALEIYTHYPFLQSDTTVSYDQNGSNPLIHTTDYTYNTKKFISLKQQLDSKGDTLRHYYKYPFDYPSQTTLAAMTSNHILSPVINDSIRKNGNLITYSKVNYYSPSSNLYVPQTVQTQNQSNLPETRQQFYKYDVHGNPIEFAKSDDVHQCYIWDYNYSHAIAQVVNADSASIAYTSFEADSKGGWTFSGTPSYDNTVTGLKIYNLNSGSISKSGLSSGVTYIVSYWTKNNNAYSITGTISQYPIAGRIVNGWKYFEHRVTGQTTITISGTGSIDELRLYPSDALMSTYCYDPLLGITSQCDANSRISYYEYDGFGRLAVTRDQDKNIIKRICYNYAGQTESCPYYYNVVKIGSFIKNDCSAGYAGSTVKDTIPAGKYGSPISQPYVDTLALRDLNSNGQANANEKGTCNFPYAVIGYTDFYEDLTVYSATMWISFYTDATFTTPFSVSNVTVNYDRLKTFCSGTEITTHLNQVCNGTSQSVGTVIFQKNGTGTQCYTQLFELTGGTGYIYQ